MASSEWQATCLTYADNLLKVLTPPATDAAASGAGEPVAWCSPGQLVNLMDVDADGGVYLPIRKTQSGNFTMPLYAPAPKAASEAGAGRVTARMIVAAKRYVRGENDAIRWAIEAALSTDATDGATVASDAAGLREALEAARLQLEYLDGRWPTGTTPAIIARIDAALTHPSPIETLAQRQAREVRNPGSGSAAQSGQPAQSYGMAAPPIESETRADHAQGGGEMLGPLWRKVQQVQADAMRHDWSVEGYRAGMASTLGITTGGDALEQAARYLEALVMIAETQRERFAFAGSHGDWCIRTARRALSPARDGAGS